MIKHCHFGLKTATPHLVCVVQRPVTKDFNQINIISPFSFWTEMNLDIYLIVKDARHVVIWAESEDPGFARLLATD